MEIKKEVIINATPEKVWAVLTDFKSYPAWNPFIKSVEGKVEVGNKLTVTIMQSGEKGTTFKPKVLTVIPAKEISWLGRLLLPNIFDGEHKFELIGNSDGTTTFRQSEKFTGILVPFFKKQLDNNTALGFEGMNEKLKELAEKK